MHFHRKVFLSAKYLVKKMLLTNNCPQISMGAEKWPASWSEVSLPVSPPAFTIAHLKSRVGMTNIRKLSSGGEIHHSWRYIQPVMWHRYYNPAELPLLGLWGFYQISTCKISITLKDIIKEKENISINLSISSIHKVCKVQESQKPSQLSHLITSQ